MLQKTRGIVLHYLRYGDTSIIVKIYTEQLGLQTYIVNGVRTAKAKNGKMALYQPLTLLDMVVYHEPEKQRLFRISEVRCAAPYQSLPFEIRKTTVALFLAEVLSKSLQEESAQAGLYQFIEQSLLRFDAAQTHYDDFHFHFLLQLAQYLGFAPSNAREIREQLREIHRWRASPTHEDAVMEWLQNTLQTENPAPLSPVWRGELLDILLDFYSLHVEGMHNLKSLDVLRELAR